MKRIFLALLAISVDWPSAAFANAQGDIRVARDEPVAISDRAGSDRAEMTSFVLAEVRRELEANAANKVVSVSIDPDYTGGEDSYLVNAVLAAHDQQFTLGVIVTCHAVSNGWKSELAFVD